ncbi:hypothetical protein C0993_011583 [Termitomyces sp. T159_Od127]|nr:hypothetical protein C0993_011583 [Termitomyces sp. T159_Od127]
MQSVEQLEIPYKFALQYRTLREFPLFYYTMATILYDNDSPHLTFFDSVIGAVGYGPVSLGGTTTFSSNLSVIFQGTSIKLFGFLLQSKDVIVRIDGKIQLYTPTLATPAPPINAFYQSQILPDTIHNLTMSDGRQDSLVAIDYVTITAGESTPLQGESLIVDDNDPSVVFEGEWVLITDLVLQVPDGSRFAYESTAHQTSSPGASATFHFNGLSPIKN